MVAGKFPGPVLTVLSCAVLHGAEPLLLSAAADAGVRQRGAERQGQGDTQCSVFSS